MDVFQTICEKVGMAVIGKETARRAVLELLPCINRTEQFAVRNPTAVSLEITEYLDSLVRNP